MTESLAIGSQTINTATDNIYKPAAVVILAGGASRRMGNHKALLTLPSNERLLDYHIRHASTFGVPVLIADNERDFRTQATVNDTLIQHISDYHPPDTSSDVGSTSQAARKAVPDNDTVTSHNTKNMVGALAAITGAMQQLTTTLRLPRKLESNAQLVNLWLMVISCDSLVNTEQVWQILSPQISGQTSKSLTSDTKESVPETLENTEKSIICLAGDSYPYPLLGLYRMTLLPDLMSYLDAGNRRVIEFIQPRAHCVPLPQSWYGLTNINTPDDFKRACSQLWP